MLPSSYRPQTPADFIGPARASAEGLAKLAAAASAEGDPVCVLFLGRPGVGKSSLANFFARTLGATSQWNFVDCRPVNGKEVNLDFILRASASWRLSSLSSGYRIFQIEEVDRITADAQVVLLTMLDQMPRRSAVIASTNRPLEHFEERFQRRFKTFQIDGPDTEELRVLLTRLGVSESSARMIAGTAAGNVGAALQDADLVCLT